MLKLILKKHLKLTFLLEFLRVQSWGLYFSSYTSMSLLTFKFILYADDTTPTTPNIFESCLELLQVIRLQGRGVDVRPLFPHVCKLLATPDLLVKKMVYW